MLAQLEQNKDEIRAAGLKIVAVGIGKPKHAARYGGKLAPSVTCLANETNDVHFAWGLKRRGLGQLLEPKLYVASIRATQAGFTQGRATGDTAMLGGLFVVAQTGIIRYVYVNDYAGDYPEIADVLKAVKT
ncbi:MAG: hypothetical protein HYZ49_02590 [Chloroflexi bacterium]|nr:hypothetical protein [Chloroflexota bacterium]